MEENRPFLRVAKISQDIRDLAEELETALAPKGRIYIPDLNGYVNVLCKREAHQEVAKLGELHILSAEEVLSLDQEIDGSEMIEDIPEEHLISVHRAFEERENRRARAPQTVEGAPFSEN
jgi:hypothetical protein